MNNWIKVHAISIVVCMYFYSCLLFTVLISNDSKWKRMKAETESRNLKQEMVVGDCHFDQNRLQYIK